MNQDVADAVVTEAEIIPAEPIHLTHQQEHFARLIAEGGMSQSEAYRKAYPTSTKWKPEAVWTQASQLANDSKVRLRVSQLRQELLDAAAMTLESHLSELERLKRNAARAGEHGVALKAEELRGRVSGFYVTKVEAGRPGEHDAADEAAARRRLAERAARLGVKLPDNIIKLPSK